MNKYNKIEICGGGLFGILLAAKFKKLFKENRLNKKIIIVERGTSILPGWQASHIGDYRFNNGFHGLEMPRSKDTHTILNSLLRENIFCQFENFKLILLNESLIPFRSDSSSWPNKWKEGLDDFFKENNKDEDSRFNLNENLSAKLGKFRLGRLLKSCSKRYSNNIGQAWYQIYPWFFPSEFNFSDNDEGFKTQQKVRNGMTESYYLEPKSGIFSDLIPDIQNSLLKENIQIKTNSLITSKDLISNDDDLKDKKTLRIWSASSSPLLKSLNPKEHSKLFTDKSFLHLILFQCSTKQLLISLKKFKKLPSEILCMSINSPGMARVSFPKRNNSRFVEPFQILLVEYYSQFESIDNNEISRVKSSLKAALPNEYELIGSKKGRIIFNFPHSFSYEANKLLEKHSLNTFTKVPFKYWWPINMAKCGLAANEACQKLSKEFM